MDILLKSKIKSDDSISKEQFGLGIKASYDFDMFRIYRAYIYDFEAKTIHTKILVLHWNEARINFSQC